MGTGSVRLRLARAIDADPGSTALLLAGPSAVELWPGPPGAVAAVVAEPPHRTPTAFVHRFSWTGPDLPAATGVLTLTYAPGDESPSTAAELVLDVAARGDAGEGDHERLASLAEQFLLNLARAASDRRAA